MSGVAFLRRQGGRVFRLDKGGFISYVGRGFFFFIAVGGRGRVWTEDWKWEVEGIFLDGFNFFFEVRGKVIFERMGGGRDCQWLEKRGESFNVIAESVGELVGEME